MSNLSEGLVEAVQYKKNIKGRNQESNYALDYSPNNIKSLVIAPDVAYVVTYLKVQNLHKGRMSITQVRDEITNAMTQIQCGKLTKHPLDCLGGTGNIYNKCQNIESIIIFKRPTNTGGIDSQTASIIQRGFTSYLTYNINNKITPKFNRLKFIAELDCPIPQGLDEILRRVQNSVQFEEEISKLGIRSCKVMSLASEEEQSAKVTIINTKTDSYPFDVEVRKHLTIIKEQYLQQKEEGKKEEAIAEYKNNKYRDYYTELETYNKYYELTFILLRTLHKYKHINIAYTVPLNEDILRIKLYKTDKLLEKQELLPEENISEDMKIKYNMEQIKNYRGRLITVVSDCFFSNLEVMANNEVTALSTKVYLKNLDEAMLVPSTLQSKVQNLYSALGLENNLTGNNYDDCLCNLLTHFCRLFINLGSRSTDAPTTKSYWLNKIRKG